ncbi:MAG TPA: hypothetical protein VMG34_05010 [Bacteroidota bacterium]|nr:hypothetical protein [Bacteroidota bacterium]
MIRFLIWIILIYLLAKVLGVVLQVVRPLFDPPESPQPTVRVKQNKSQFDNVQDADFEDVTDKK